MKIRKNLKFYENLSEAVGASTYTVIADVGYSRSESPNLSLDAAIVSTRRELQKQRGHVYITWVDEQTGDEVLKYDARLHSLKTNISKAETELNRVLKALREHDRHSRILGEIAKLFTQEELATLKPELEMLRRKMAQIEKLSLSQLEQLSKNTTTPIKESYITEGWYGADSEVEFDTSVYPDIAKYFGLSQADKVYYAYYFTDQVIVNYTDAAGRDREIEKHVPLHQVEEWFKAGYTILDENFVQDNESLKEAGNPHGMAYWAAEYLGEFYKMIKTNVPKPGTAAFNKISRNAYKRMKERWGLTPDEIDGILQKGYGLWKEFFM